MRSADPPPGKMDENLKNENRQKSSFLNGGGGEGEVIPVMTGWVKLMIIIIVIIQIYFRLHHFVVKFAKFSSPQAARGH